jgi:hypothetical protein
LAEHLIPLPEPSRAQRVSLTCPPPETNDYLIAGVKRIDRWVDYSRWWLVMGEPYLSCGANVDDEVYRFRWTHAFADLNPLAVRISRSGENSQIHVYELRFTSTPLLYYEVKSHVERRLTGAEWAELMSKINDEFWNMETISGESGNDGAMWTIEGRKELSYHAVER